MTNIAYYAALALMIFSVVALVSAPWVLRPSKQSRRILDIVQSNRPQRETVSQREVTKDRLFSVARTLRARMGLTEDEKLRQRFIAAGLRGSSKMEVYFAARMMLPLLGVIGGSFVHGNTFFWCICLAGVGYLGPDIWLTRSVRARTKRLQRGIPDAIDLLVICVEAGLGLDQAILRVGQELAVSYPEINEEFTQINLEQRAGKARIDAWQSLADRTKLEEFKALVAMLTQTDRFGTPIVRALSRYSEELRTSRRQKAEEAAAKTKVKILFPLIFFIFPCIFIVLLGPAILSLSRSFK
jgi:tight adherence protein C